MPPKLPFDEPTNPAEHSDAAVDVRNFLGNTGEVTKPATMPQPTTSSSGPWHNVFQSTTASSDATQPLEPVHVDSASELPFEEATSPGLLPIPKTGAEAAGEKRGDIGQLLMSVGPFLWSLEAAVKWIEAHGAGDVEAEGHVRSLALFARVLGQLQARIDEVRPPARPPRSSS